MDQIFTFSDSPFYKSAIPITINPIEQNVFSDFIEKKFKKSKRKIKKEILDTIFDITDGISGDALQLCEAVWSVSSENQIIDSKIVSEAFQLIFAREQRSYEIIFSGLSANQQNVLCGMANHPKIPLNSADFLRLSSVRQPSSVNASLKKLIERRLIHKKENGYNFSNPFFKLWIVNKK